MKLNQNVLGAVHALLWIAAGVAANLVFSGSPSRAGYGLLCAWWVTLYVALLVGTTWRALPAFLVLMVVALVFDAIQGAGFLYHDASSVDSSSVLVLAFVLVLLWASPIAVNQLAMRIHHRLIEARNTK